MKKYYNMYECIQTEFDTGIIKTSLLPSLAKILVSSSATQAVRDATTVQQGDIDIQQDNEIAYIYDQAGAWQELSVTPTISSLFLFSCLGFFVPIAGL